MRGEQKYYSGGAEQSATNPPPPSVQTRARRRKSYGRTISPQVHNTQQKKGRRTTSGKEAPHYGDI